MVESLGSALTVTDTRTLPFNMELERIELQLQDSATWRVLESATRHGDVVYQFHGAAVVALPTVVATVIGIISEHSAAVANLAAVIIIDIAAGFLIFLSTHEFRVVGGLRFLQFELDAAANVARRRLALEHRPTYFTRDATPPRLLPLREQRDPMGSVVASVARFVLVDSFVAALVLTLSLALGVGYLSGISASVGAASIGLAISVAAGAIVALVVRRNVHADLEAAEARVAESIARRWAELA